MGLAAVYTILLSTIVVGVLVTKWGAWEIDAHPGSSRVVRGVALLALGLIMAIAPVIAGLLYALTELADRSMFENLMATIGAYAASQLLMKVKVKAPDLDARADPMGALKKIPRAAAPGCAIKLLAFLLLLFSLGAGMMLIVHIVQWAFRSPVR